LFSVIAGHSRPKDGVGSLAYDPGNPSSWNEIVLSMDARVKPAHDRLESVASDIPI
jgi:hypothetical protein